VQQEVHQQHNFINSHDNLGVSKVDCSQNGMAMVNTAPPDSYGDVVDCGIVDHPPADCSRMTATAVAHQGIFANPCADEWTALERNPKHIQQSLIKSSSCVISLLIQSWLNTLINSNGLN
jgi:hypothetical protein